MFSDSSRNTALVIVCAVFGLLAGTRDSVAELGRIYKLPEMIRSSDTIVIAHVELEPPVVPNGEWQAKLTVLQTILGKDAPPALSIFFVPKLTGPNFGAKVSTRIVFLKHQNGELQLANPSYPTLPAINLAPPQNLDTLGMLIAEEGEVISSPSATDSEKEEAIDMLGRCDDGRVIGALNRGLSDPLPRVRFEAVSRLAAKGDANALSIAESTVLTPPSDLPDNVLHNLQVGIRDGARSEANVVALARLLKDSNKETREAAAKALRYIGSRSTIEPLQQALFDTDPEVRYFAVVGLATVTGQLEHMPNRITFRDDEDKYTNYWKQWKNPQ